MRFTSLFPFLLSLATAVSAAEIGGTFPWRTLQAEEAETNAERLKPSRRAGDFAAECVGKSGVRLNRAGDYVEFTAPAAANSIVVRYAIPDAPRGGGEEHTLSGYVDGKHRFDLKLSSRHTWLYGKEHDPVNDPEELKRLPARWRAASSTRRVCSPDRFPPARKSDCRRMPLTPPGIM